MKMKRAVLLVLVALLGLPGHLPAQTEPANSIQQAILGTWKLVSYVREELPSGAKSDVMGAHPSGYINYGPDGRMIVIIVGSDRKKPAGAVATPDEAEALIRSMLAYAGTYTIDSQAKTVTHHIDISWDQSRTGTDHVRSYKLEGNHLTLTTEPSTDPATGKKTVRTLLWERLK
ncbi:MAG TPA: lipocalin-like domain-containing protein [Terriglobales bacterium]|nr:lipocalin-like domain-containing protein [Terriglobales bacterium]